MNGRVAVGRVKTPILAIVCRRELEIQNFKPKTVYGVEIVYDKDFKGTLFASKGDNTTDVTDEDTDNKEASGTIWFETLAEAEALIKTLAPTATVISVDKTHEKTFAPKLFKLASAQTEAGKRGFKADEVLNIIQGLYERKFLSYPRTDCEYLSSTEDFVAFLKTCKDVSAQAQTMVATGNTSTDIADLAALAPFIAKITMTDINNIKKMSKYVNDKELEKSGHSALRPTEDVPQISSLNAKELAIYTMITRRFVAIFLPPMEYDKSVVVTECNGSTFRSSGKIITAKGYTEALGKDSTDTVLPTVTKGEVLGVTDKHHTEKTSVCPKRYSDGELVAACENPLKYLCDESLKRLGKDLSIGTPATRASIISQLIDKDKYMERVKDGKIERIKPTDNGMAIINALGDREICKVDMTGLWEEKLQLVRSGNLDLATLEKEMIDNVNNLILDIKNMTLSVSLGGTGRYGATVCTCPACGKNIIVGKTSFFCEGYKEKTCNVGVQKEILTAQITEEDAKALFEGKEIEKKMKKDKNTWSQKLKYDPEEKKVVFIRQESAETAYKCPKCKNKNLVGTDEVVSCECGFKQWRTVAHKRLSDKDWNDLLSEGKTGLIRALKGKSGKSFDAYLLFNDSGDLEFKFPPRK